MDSKLTRHDMLVGKVNVYSDGLTIHKVTVLSDGMTFWDLKVDTCVI